MGSRLSLTMAAAVVAAGVLAPEIPASAQPAGVALGTMTCNVSSGWGFVLGSSRDLVCTYSPRPGIAEHYVGEVQKFGVDIGYVSNAVVVWSVVTPTADMAPGALAGQYIGATGGASVGVGIGANVLFGGSDRSIALQPVSFEGSEGLNVAAGIGSIGLKFQGATAVPSG